MTINTVTTYQNILLSLKDREDSRDKFIGWISLNFEILEKLKTLSSAGLADSSLRIKKDNVLLGSTANLDAIKDRHYSPEYTYEIKLEKNNINNGD